MKTMFLKGALALVFVMNFCGSICWSQEDRPGATLAACYLDAQRFVDNANDGTIDATRMPTQQLYSKIRYFQDCLTKSQDVSESTWSLVQPGFTSWRYAAALWAAIAIAEDGLLSQTSEALQRCGANKPGH
jgi:hypothetical protein